METKEMFETLKIEDIDQNNPHHNSTLIGHTERVVECVSKRGSEKVIVAAQLHDIGKPSVAAVNPNGFTRFIGHADKSVEICLENKSQLFDDFSEDEIDYIIELVRLHDQKPVKQAKVQQIIDKGKDFVEDLLILQLADIFGQSEYQRAEKLQEVKDFALRLNIPEEQIDEYIKLMNN